jgi:hypothetical protein
VHHPVAENLADVFAEKPAVASIPKELRGVFAAKHVTLAVTKF